MNGRWKHVLTAPLVIAALALGACGEKAQTLGSRKGSPPAWQGAANSHAAPGWTAGDQKSWESQMTERAKAQNEYLRIGGTR